MICHSGGADGADMAFERECAKYGISVMAHSFEGHTTKSTNRINWEEKALFSNEEILAKVAKSLGKNKPGNNYVGKLIRRNFFQINETDVVFAVSSIDGDKVKGGTGWACEVAKIRDIPLFVFDQEDNRWHYWNETEFIPCPDGPVDLLPNDKAWDFTGIGSRSLTEAGEEAIKQLLKNISAD